MFSQLRQYRSQYASSGAVSFRAQGALCLGQTLFTDVIVAPAPALLTPWIERDAKGFFAGYLLTDQSQREICFLQRQLNVAAFPENVAPRAK
jgi:hypothetical protein